MCPFHCIYVLHTNSNPLTSKIKHTFACVHFFFCFDFVFSNIFRYHFWLHYPKKLHWNYLLGINWNNENDFMRFIVFFVIWWALILNNIVEIKLPIASNYINSVHCSNKAYDFCFFFKFLFKVIPVRSCVRVCASVLFFSFFFALTNS